MLNGGAVRVTWVGHAQAVKRLSLDHATGAGNREFSAELVVLGSLSHRYLVRLVDSCAAGHDRSSSEPASTLRWWPACLRVTCGATAALADRWIVRHWLGPPGGPAADIRCSTPSVLRTATLYRTTIKKRCPSLRAPVAASTPSSSVATILSSSCPW